MGGFGGCLRVMVDLGFGDVMMVRENYIVILVENNILQKII